MKAILVATLLACFLLGAAACAKDEAPSAQAAHNAVPEPPGPPPPPNVLLIVLDTARADAVSAYGNMRAFTPNFDSLAGEGKLFLDAKATSCWTLPSHASIFTGLYSYQHNAHHETDLLAEDQITVAELLSNEYTTAGFSENPHVIRAKGFAKGFEYFDETWRPRDPATHLQTIGEFSQWFASRDRTKPFFAFVNLITPHLPYDPPARWREHFFSEAERATGAVDQLAGFREAHARLYMSGGLEISGDAMEILRRLYLADTAYADERMADLIQPLRQEGVLDDTLLIIVGDHGENIGDHGLMEHQFGLYETALRVPLLMRFPRIIAAGEERAPVQLVDIAPTILDITGADSKLYRHMAGVSVASSAPVPNRPLLAEYMRPLQQKPLFARINPGFDFSRFDRRLKSLEVDRLKLIAADNGELELFDLSSDPGEVDNLLSTRPDDARRLRKQLMDMVGGWVPKQTNTRPDLDQEALEELRSLGYIN